MHVRDFSGGIRRNAGYSLGHFPVNRGPRIYTLEWQRLADCISLGIVHTDFTQRCKHLIALDKFGDGALTHHLCYVNDHFDHGPVDLAIQHFRYKAAIYLDVVDGQMLEVGERGHAGTEVVKREAAAQFL